MKVPTLHANSCLHSAMHSPMDVVCVCVGPFSRYGALASACVELAPPTEITRTRAGALRDVHKLQRLLEHGTLLLVAEQPERPKVSGYQPAQWRRMQRKLRRVGLPQLRAARRSRLGWRQLRLPLRRGLRWLVVRARDV